MSRPYKTHDLPATFAAVDAYQAGFTRRQLQRKKMRNLAYGVYCQVPEADFADYAFARSRTLPDGVLACLTAARIYGFRGVDDFYNAHKNLLESPIFIYRLSGNRVRQKGMKQLYAALAEHEHTLIRGERITTVPRTFLDLGTVLSVDNLVVVADGLLAHHRPAADSPLVKREELENYLASVKHHRGKSKCLQALELAVTGSDSVKETELRLLLGRYGVRNLQANPVIRDEYGQYICQPDLADMERKVSIQYEGAHHQNLAQMRKDDERRRRTEFMGWKEVRIFAADLYREVPFRGEWMPLAVAKVLEALAF